MIPALHGPRLNKIKSLVSFILFFISTFELKVLLETHEELDEYIKEILEETRTENKLKSEI